MDTDTINLINKEDHHQAFVEEKSLIRKIAGMKISPKKKQAKVRAVKFPKMTDDLSYLTSGANVF